MAKSPFFLFVTICPQSSGFLSEDLHFLPAIHWTDAVYPQGCGLGLVGLYWNNHIRTGHVVGKIISVYASEHRVLKYPDMLFSFIFPILTLPPHFRRLPFASEKFRIVTEEIQRTREREGEKS